MAKKKSEEKRFEDIIKELEGVVAALERGDLSLEEAMESFRRGVELSRECHKRLDEAERKVKILKKQAGGEVIEEDYDEGEGN